MLDKKHTFYSQEFHALNESSDYMDILIISAISMKHFLKSINNTLLRKH